MFFARFLIIMLVGGLVLPASAKLNAEQLLASQISAMLNSQNPGSADFPVIRSVKILTPADKIERLCAQPVLTLSGNDTHLTGNRSVRVQCGTERKFIQVAVQAEGTWWSIVNPLKAGATIAPTDIQSHHGSLEHQPAGLIFTPDEIVGRVTTRNVATGTPVTGNLLHKQWRIRAGQEVEVIAVGNGFRIHAQGKALDNAAVNEKLRVSMRTRQVMSGIVTSDGTILVDVK